MEITQEQLDAYNIAVKKHEAYCEKMKPLRENYITEQAFQIDTNEWSKIVSMDAPNKPGYYRANND